MSEITKTRERVDTSVGSRSLVGIHRETYPLSFGNYFWFASHNYRAVNFWAENLDELARRGMKSIDVEVYRTSNEPNRGWAVVVDEKAKGWTTRPCLTGCGAPVAVRRAMDKDHGFNLMEDVCGCEEEDEYPRVSQSWRTDESFRTNRCGRCKRTWLTER